jgi:hypothetical protein
LTDEFVEELVMQILAHWTNTVQTRLAFLEFLLKGKFEEFEVLSLTVFGRDGLDGFIAVIIDGFGRKHLVEHVFYFELRLCFVLNIHLVSIYFWFVVFQKRFHEIIF